MLSLVSLLKVCSTLFVQVFAVVLAPVQLVLVQGAAPSVGQQGCDFEQAILLLLELKVNL